MVVDCRKAQQNIELFIDGLLSGEQQKQLFSHIESCAQCKSALEQARLLKNALNSMSELEPPPGLAQSAIRKAKRRSFYPYISAAAGLAAAAVVLVAVIGFGSGGFDTTESADGDESVVYTD